LSNIADVQRQLVDDQGRVTIRQANLLHRHFLQEVYEPLRRPMAIGADLATYGLMLHYEGLLTQVNKSELRIPNDVGSPLEWLVARDGRGVFRITVTTVKTKFTLAKCSIEGREFYANVLWVTDFHTVDDKLRELDNQSVRVILARIDVPLRDPAPRPSPSTATDF
jgi:hypothetical protein